MGAVLALASLLVSATSATSFKDRRQISTLGGIYVCDKTAFNGNCEWYETDKNAIGDTGYCQQIDHPGGVVSLGPDFGLQVKVSGLPDCGGNFVTESVVCPGIFDIRGPEAFGDNVSRPTVWVWVNFVPLVQIEDDCLVR